MDKGDKFEIVITLEMHGEGEDQPNVVSDMSSSGYWIDRDINLFGSNAAYIGGAKNS